MVYFLEKTGCQELSDFFTDEPPLFLIKAVKTLFDQPRAQPDHQGMLGDFPWNSRHIRGFPREDISIGVEEVDEHAFLLGGEGGADAYRLVSGVVGVDEDLLDVLHRLKESGHPLRVGRSFSDVLPDSYELLRSEGCRSELAAIGKDIVEGAPDTKRATGSFEPTENVKEVLIDPDNSTDKMVRIGTALSPK